MTITDADRGTFQTTVEEFRPQITEDMCLPTALKNVLDEFADRHGSDSPLSLSDINDICDYRAGNASTSQNVPAKLDPEIEDHGIETNIMFNATLLSCPVSSPHFDIAGTVALIREIAGTLEGGGVDLAAERTS